MKPPMRPATRPAGSPITGWVPGPLTRGGADAKIPEDNRYYITTFGGGSDAQSVACGGPRADGTWYYLADKDRFGCSTHVRITDPASGRSVVAASVDIGPAQWVERNAGGPIIDASPLVLQYLFGRDSYGWSDRVVVIAEPVSADTPLGPSQSATGGVVTAAVLIAMAAGAWWWLGRSGR